MKWGALLFGIVIGVILLGYGAWSIDEACNREEEKSAKRKMKTGSTICIIGIVLLPEAHVLYRDGTTTAREDAKKCGGNCTECACISGGCWSLKKGEQVVFKEH